MYFHNYFFTTVAIHSASATFSPFTLPIPLIRALFILNLEVTLVKFRLNNALIKGIGTVNGEKVSEAEWMATVVDK